MTNETMNELKLQPVLTDVALLSPTATPTAHVDAAT